MKLYHGSTVRIDEILLCKSKPNKDFGRAFYLSAEESQARELAESRVSFLGGEVVVNEYDFRKCETFQYAFCTERALKYLKKL